MEKCLYCRQELPGSKWISQWCSEELHYKTTRCECGKQNWIKVDFYGSGHDTIFYKTSSLESLVRKVQEK